MFNARNYSSGDMDSEDHLLRLKEKYDKRYARKGEVVSTQGDVEMVKLPSRNNFFLCSIHHLDKVWNDQVHSCCEQCFRLNAQLLICGGKLPLGYEVLSHLLTLKATKHGKYVAGTSAEHTCAEDVILHWIKCNVYPMSVTGAYKKITNLFQEYRKLKKFSKSKSAGYWKVFNELSTKLNALFDIRANSDYTKVQENFWGVRMCTDDHAFYDDQKTRRLMSNTETIDIKWKKTKQRQMARSNRKRIETYGSCSSKSSEYQDLNHSFDENMIEEDSDDYEPDPKVRKGYEYVDTIPVEDDNMPPEYRYPRQGPHSVKLEIYQAMHIMKAKYHMSAQQIEGSLITIANVVFGRKWKPYCANEKIDNHSLPSMSNARRTERYAEAQVLNSVVEEMMSSESPCVVYSNDGSSQNGTGKYVVQSFTINGIQRTLPTLPVCTESKDTLKDLIIVTINMLSAATDNKYSIKQIFSKVNFVMTDSTAHNHGNT